MSRIKVKNTVIIILALSMLGMITGCDKKESDKTIESQTTKVESTTTEKGSKEKVVKGTVLLAAVIFDVVTKKKKS